MRSFKALDVFSLVLLFSLLSGSELSHARVSSSVLAPTAVSASVVSISSAARNFKSIYPAKVAYTQIFIDHDSDSSTGYSVSGVGAKYMLENGSLYKFTGSSSDEWSWSKIRSVSFVKGSTSAVWSGVLKSDLGGISQFKIVARNGSMASPVISVSDSLITPPVVASEPVPTSTPSPTPSPSLPPVVVAPSPTPSPSLPPVVVVPSPTPSPSASPTPPVVVVPSGSMISVSPAATSGMFNNPERGFFRTGSLTTSSSTYASYAASGRTLVWIGVDLEPYANTPVLPQSFLTQYANMFTQLRLGGVKVVLRHSYTNDDTAAGPLQSLMLGHMNQLLPIMAANADVIFTLQQGMYGAWGEGDYGRYGSNVGYNEKREMAIKMLDALPENVTLSIRMPATKIAIYNMTGPNAPAAQYASYAKRTGHHNDCFLASDSDYGTSEFYNLSNPSDWRVFVGMEANTSYVPVGGETCHESSYSTCSNALLQMQNQHWSHLNEEYHQGVLASWQSGGCYQEIERRLGYRLELNQFSIPASVSKSALFNLNMIMKNVGFSGMVNKHPVKLVFFNSSGSYSVDLNQDSRTWVPGTKNINAVVDLMTASAPIPVGDYSVAIWMPDSNSGLQSKPGYSVRFANDGWDSVKGWNVVKNGSAAIQVHVGD